MVYPSEIYVGGGLTSILIIVLVVLAIIYLVQRIR